MQRSVQLPVIKIAGDALQTAMDHLAVEEPLEIRLVHGAAASKQTRNLAVTMRTPGNDRDLAMGFLFTEGIIKDHTEVLDIDHVFVACSGNKENTIQVTLTENAVPHLLQADRNFYTTSSCGVCGKTSIEAIRTVSATAAATCSGNPLDTALIKSLPSRLNGHQEIFSSTGGLHAAALFNEAGDLLLLREDVGRHNAVDKLVGAALGNASINLSQSILLLSGRSSFELVQKAAMAGIPVVAAVGAPSSLAVSLAEEFGITLIGFLRNNRFNIYTAAHRIQLPVYENTD